MVHDGGEASVLDGSGTRISDLNAAFAAGATIEAAFPLPTSVVLVLRWPMTRNVPRHRAAPEDVSIFARPDRGSGVRDGSSRAGGLECDSK